LVERIPFLSPTFPEVDALASDYEAILRRRIFSNGGPVEQELARALSRWVNNEIGASLVSSGTAGLQLAINATFNAKREYALVASFTFAAGPLAIRLCGYEPVFLDVDPESWQPSLDDAAEFLTVNGESTAGLLLTNTFGVANEEIEAWEVLADRHSLPLVVDSAAGFGSQYLSDERLGARGTCEVFSFHATKTLAIGEAGAVTSRDPELIKRIDRIKNFGFDEARNAVVLGTNAKLSELSCAIGLRQLAALPDRLALRRGILGLYREELCALGVYFQPSSELSALPFVSALLPSSAARAATLATLQAAGVEARTYYNPPVHLHSLFAGSRLACRSLSTTLDLASRVISLPMSDDLTAADVARIARACREAQSADVVQSR
jgi:dTDP-4-amino-4,6-dideoxygalactose transaminase